MQNFQISRVKTLTPESNGTPDTLMLTYLKLKEEMPFHYVNGEGYGAKKKPLLHNSIVNWALANYTKSDLF